MAETSRPEGGGVAHQHGTPERLTNEALRRLIQEAVDQAMAAIQRGERDPAAIAREVGERTGLRAAMPGAEIAALEARLKGVEERLKGADDRHGRVEARVDELSHHVGPRETIDVAHVPPEILERSFQAMLDELCAELTKVKGRDEAERVLDAAVADVRGQSKGAELFTRAEQRIVIQGLAACVNKKLLSARAAQATFDEVVKHLRLHLPHYRPRPVAAMIRMRSHDFAVEASVRHHERLKEAEARLQHLLAEAKRIEAEAKAADASAADGVSKSFTQALMERRHITEEFQSRIKSLEKRAMDAEDRLQTALARLEAVEKYATRVEAAMIRKTKEGTFKGDFTPVIDAVHEALADGKSRRVADVAKRVKGVDREVVDAVIREAVKEGVFTRIKGGKVRLKR